MDADKVIEWITQVMAIELTTPQENMIRLHCDGGDESYRSYARGGYRFAEVMVRAYSEAEEEVHIQQDMARQMLKGHSVGEAVMDEVARIPEGFFERTPAQLMGRELALESMAHREKEK